MDSLHLPLPALQLLEGCQVWLHQQTCPAVVGLEEVLVEVWWWWGASGEDGCGADAACGNHDFLFVVIVVVILTSRYRVLLRYSPSQAPASTKIPPLFSL